MKAMIASALMIAQMVAAKTLRDAAFLATFPANMLPWVTGLAAVLAIASSFAASKLFTRIPPSAILPTGFLMSGLLQLAEYQLYVRDIHTAAVVIFLHVFVINLLLTSAFWLLMTEYFDLRSAQRAFGKITAMGTLGGILGGLAAAAIGSIPMLILFTAALHIACAVALWGFPSTEPPGPPAPLKPSPYLMNLAGLAVTVSIGAGVLDYLFKWQATQTIAPGPALTRFLALFYTATSLLSVGVQALAKPAVRSLPAAMALGAGTLIFSFGFPGLVLLRGIESILRGSTFRAGYEVFYTFIAAREKRAVKSVIDITGERLGDLLASAFILVLLAWNASSPPLLLGIVIASAVGALLLALSSERQYLKALEKSLVRQPKPLASDVGPQSGIIRPGGVFDSGSDHRITDLIPQLGDDEVAFIAIEKLRGMAPKHAGQLADALLDPLASPVVRRRIPLILAVSRSQLALDALTLALKDPEHQVRLRSAHAMRRILKENPSLLLQTDRLWSIVEAESDVDFIFSLLRLLLPSATVAMAQQALSTDDRRLRGTALEYLEKALPPATWKKLEALIEHQPKRS